LEFGNHIALYFLVLAGLGAVLFVLEAASSRRSIERFAAAGVVDKILVGFSRRRRILKRSMVVLALGFLVLAWAMPRMGKGTRIVKREGADVVVALDVSASMLAEDVSPSRMEVAKQAVINMILRLPDDRFALVGFAGSAFINCPLTLDRDALAMFVDFLNPGVVSAQGTDIGAAVNESLHALQASTGRGKAIVLITDGEDHGSDLDDALKRATAAGVRIYALGIGTPGGEPIPIKNAEGSVVSYKRDQSDNVVVTRLNESVLERMAGETGGESYRLGSGDREVTRVAKAIEGLEKGLFEQRTFEDYLQLFPFPLGLCLLLLVAEALVAERIGPRNGARHV
jgi:Ca-activated chloride channel family protein